MRNIKVQREQIEIRRFKSFCKKVLRNERNQIYNEDKKQSEKEVSLSNFDFGLCADKNLVSHDRYYFVENSMKVLDFVLYIENDLLFTILEELPSKKRTIILLSFWLGMSDREISERLLLPRSNIGYLRRSAMVKIRERLEDNKNDKGIN